MKNNILQDFSLQGIDPFEAKDRIQIIFDIDVTEAEKLAGPSYKKLWSKIKAYFLENGFEHIEYSGYASKEPISFFDSIELVKSMIKTFPVLDKCMEDIHMSIVPEVFSLNEYFHYDGNKSKEKKVNDDKSIDINNTNIQDNNTTFVQKRTR